jgi:hypothetical protein
MVATEILVAAAIGAALRIIQMDGWSLKVFYQGGVLQIGAIATLVIGIVGAVLAAYSGYPGFDNPITAFFLGFTVPFAIDQFVTKLPIGGTAPSIVEVAKANEGA